jgi:hypothetical protein
MDDKDWDSDLYPTSERRLMFEIGWLDLWHALRETAVLGTSNDGE